MYFTELYMFWLSTFSLITPVTTASIISNMKNVSSIENMQWIEASKVTNSEFNANTIKLPETTTEFFITETFTPQSQVSAPDVLSCLGKELDPAQKKKLGPALLMLCGILSLLIFGFLMKLIC
ncbi:hypothetical protein QKT26_gp43 [Carcinus maenas nudivirus]|uniref:Uncharacterized protein n=1 Tax=Carcinus maenas nudivirus TaxID=2880837 RepID=A0AAE9BZC4_9VIRU|nr:hypothetical protein QKT26_gp43 [Carcinus maenas nudivirus]UBZ25633.1 hypothetical protein CmNV_042 [Carcinus maenas nudivirus]